MKKCPKCKAEIQENARFCLYCMTSFEEKQPVETPKENHRRLLIIAAVLVFSLMVFGIVLWAGKSKPPAAEKAPSEPGNDLQVSVGQLPSVENQPQTGSPDQMPESGGIQNDPQPNNAPNNNTADGETSPNDTPAVQSPGGGETPVQTLPNDTPAVQTPSGGETPVQTLPDDTPAVQTPSGGETPVQTPPNDPPAVETPSVEEPPVQTPSNETPSEGDAENDTPETNAPPVTQPKYQYITATVENTYPTGYSTIYAPENAIVITKVNGTEESGNYVIPDTIDGKKVAAIMPSAFSDASVCSTVKSVTLPSTVRTLWSNAFKDCVNLKDLYVRSSAIAIYEDAFPPPANRNGTLTIHCKRDCRNFDFYYYRNIATRYGADYEEWNG